MNNKDKGKFNILKSIRFKLMAISVFITILTIALILLANNLFLEKYYIKKKEKNVVKIYNQLKEVYVAHDLKESLSGDGDEDDEGDNNKQIYTIDDNMDYLNYYGSFSEDEVLKINDICEKEGITLISDNENGEMEVSYGPTKELRSRLRKMIFEVPLKDDYIVSYEKDEKEFEKEAIVLFGTINSKHYIIIRVAMKNISENVDLSNNFFMYVGFIAILLSIVLIFIVSSSFTKPIRNLSKLSERMSDLDFTSKYQSTGSGDEIDTLGNSMNNLSNKLESTITELKEANEKLQEDIKIKTEVDEMRKEFISNVSHELKTPIALISGYAEGLIDGVNDDPESQKMYCEIIADEASKMNKMVKKLLTLNKIEFGKVETYPDKFDIISVICGILGNTQILLEDKNIDVVFAENNSYMVYADEFQTEEVITNFISNAINHCAPNTEGRKMIKISVNDEGDKVRVNVFNTGNPIPEEELEKIWIKFYKVDKARTREYGGSGIGLSIVKAITNSMGTECGAINENDGVSFFATFNKPKENYNDSNN